MPTVRVPSGVFLSKPTRQSVFFNGRYINLRAIAQTQRVNISTLSNTLRGRSKPTMDIARKLAAALGMNVDDFYTALDARVASIQERNKRVISKYDGRRKREVKQDIERILHGQPPVPRIPLEKSV